MEYTYFLVLSNSGFVLWQKQPSNKIMYSPPKRNSHNIH